MTNVSEWSVTAGSNNSAPPDGAPENMLPGKVNDCLRELMAALAKWYKDSSSSLLTAGTTTAYTLTTNSVHAALSDIPLLTFRLHAANTGAVTLNVDGLGAKPLRKTSSLADFASGDLTAGQTMVVAYNSATDDFEKIGPVTDIAMPVDTVMLFVQSAAPTGWTKLLTHHNKALRLTTGAVTTGGSTAFTSVFTARTILQAHLPSYNLTHLLTLPNHIHSNTFALTNGTNVLRNGNSTSMDDAGGGFTVPYDVDSDTVSISGAVGDPTTNPAIGGTVPSGGSGTALDFAVQYVDVIMAEKD